MSDETLEKMWNILKENDFQIDVTIKSEFKCTSCKNVMIKPCNVPCGCRYCYECLINYLDGEEKFCLGETDDCKSVLIYIDKNVFNDQVANMGISKIVVKCPFESCKFDAELRKMADHMRTCERQPVECPYYIIGCEDNKISADKMKHHFKQENYCHARLLMDLVGNWRNEMKLLKTTILNLEEENKYIKEQMQSKQERILALEENVANILQESTSLKELEICHWNNQIEENILAMQSKSKLNDELEKNKKKLDELETNQEEMKNKMERITQENTSLREELEIIKLDSKAKEVKSKELNDEIEKNKRKRDELETNQEEMKGKIERITQENTSLREELEIIKLDSKAKETKSKEEQVMEKVKEKCEFLEENQEKMNTKIDKMSQEENTMGTKSKQSENALKTLETKLTQFQTNQNCNEFLWRIENWDEKKEHARNEIQKSIYSDSFYSHKNGYKMCLRLFPDGTHLSLYICIMRGEFDNILQWPFRHGIKLDLLNQETGLTHVSKIVKYEDSPTSVSWKKPVSEINAGYGRREFMNLLELSSNSALCRGNQIWIKATPQLKL